MSTKRLGLLLMVLFMVLAVLGQSMAFAEEYVGNEQGPYRITITLVRFRLGSVDTVSTKFMEILCPALIASN